MRAVTLRSTRRRRSLVLALATTSLFACGLGCTSPDRSFAGAGGGLGGAGGGASASTTSTGASGGSDTGAGGQGTGGQGTGGDGGGYAFPAGHFAGMHVLDFGRNLKYIGDSAQRAQAYDFFAAHVDVAEGQHAELTSRNPAMKTFAYDLDLSACLHQSCAYAKPASDETAALPEEAFLHFAEDTTIDFVEFGTPKTTVTIPGCPDGTPVTKECRAQAYVWTDARWIYDPKDPDFRAWMAARLVAHAKAGENDGIFLDEHAPGFKTAFGYGDSTKVTAGGAIREYGSKAPDDALNAAYIADVVDALAGYRKALAAEGRFLVVNTAGWSSKGTCIDQAVAAGGVHTETMFRPDTWDGAAAFSAFIGLVDAVKAADGAVDLVGSTCYWGPNGYDAGDYGSSRARYGMWRLAAYHLLREKKGGPGTVFFNPTFCIQFDDPAKSLDFIDEWQKGFETDLGAPVSDATVVQTGTAGCNYSIYGREFEKGRVLVRPKDGWNCNDFSDATGAAVDLDAPLSPLREDGTKGSPVSSVIVRNADAVILLK